MDKHGANEPRFTHSIPHLSSFLGKWSTFTFSLSHLTHWRALPSPWTSLQLPSPPPAAPAAGLSWQRLQHTTAATSPTSSTSSSATTAADSDPVRLSAWLPHGRAGILMIDVIITVSLSIQKESGSQIQNFISQVMSPSSLTSPSKLNRTLSSPAPQSPMPPAHPLRGPQLLKETLNRLRTRINAGP